MAKSEETRDRIVMHFETDEDGMGRFATMLTKLGATNIGWELITETLAYKGKAGNGETVARIREMVAGMEGVITTKAITRLMRDEGRALGGIYNAVDKLIGEGVLQKIGTGTYQKLGGLIEGPKPKVGRGNNQRRLAVPNFEVVLKYIGGRKRFKVAELKALFEQQGRNTSSMTSLLSKFKAEKLVKAIGFGEYEVNAEAVAKFKKQKASPPKPESKLNGATPTVTADEANANG